MWVTKINENFCLLCFLRSQPSQIATLGFLFFSLAMYSLDANGQLTKAKVDLRAAPDSASKVVGSLQPETSVKIVKRQGFWLEVESKGAKGWLKAASISFPTSTSGLSSLKTGREGKGNIVSTSAARGLSSKELVSAKPDLEQVRRLESLAVDTSAASKFALQGQLGLRTVALLAAPAKEEKPRRAAGEKSSKKVGKVNATRDDDDEDDEDDEE